MTVFMKLQPATFSPIKFALLGCCLAILSTATHSTVTEHRISSPDGEWLNYGRDYREQRYSPQQEINKETVAKLGLQWSYTFPTTRVMESTPLMHDGKLYVTTPWSQVFSLDAKTGEQRWHFDPKVPKSHLVNSCCGPANRGAALWSTAGKTLVYVGTFDGRLIALDADSGEQVWSTQTTELDSHYTITGAPRVVNGKVIIGNGGAELGVRGYVSAYDASTGEQLWRFYTVPGNPNKPQENKALQDAVSSWSGEWWQYGGGGTAWDAMAYDPELDLLYIGTGNGSPWNRNIRSPDGGDNLYLSSIVALRPDSGEYVWHYQVTPKENWDYTATQHLMLADIQLQGESETRPVIMQAPKNGFFYVLDRRTGELLSAEAYAQINWASHVDMKTGRPVENPVADYQKTGGSLIWPAPLGAHSWQPMAYHPDTKLVYIPQQHIVGYYSADEKFSFTQHRFNTGIDLWETRYHHDPIIARATKDAMVRGYLTAWDPVTQSARWRVEHPQASNGGILATGGGLVFQGTGTGGFHAYDASSGEKVWSYQTDSAVLAGPISYSLDGEQYIAVTQGSGGAVMLSLGIDGEIKRKNPNRLLVFKLQSEENKHSADFKKVKAEFTAPPVIKSAGLSEAQLLQGEKTYERSCSTCHGIHAHASTAIPDLRYMSEKTHTEFLAIVLGGIRHQKGMVGFYETLTAEQTLNIQGYLIERNQALHAEIEMTGLWDNMRYWFWYFLSWISDKFPALANASRDSMMAI